MITNLTGHPITLRMNTGDVIIQPAYKVRAHITFIECGSLEHPVGNTISTILNEVSVIGDPCIEFIAGNFLPFPSNTYERTKEIITTWLGKDMVGVVSLLTASAFKRGCLPRILNELNIKLYTMKLVHENEDKIATSLLEVEL